MSHDASVVYMGTHGSSAIEVSNHAGDVDTFVAGLCCHLKSDDTLSLASSDGSKLGISLGRSLSDTDVVSIARKGEMIPILLANGFTPDIGAQVQISTTTGKAVSSGTAVNAVYRTSTLTAYDEDGVEITDGAAYIDFVGGL